MEGATAGVTVGVEIQARMESTVLSSVPLNRKSPQCCHQPGFLHKSDIVESVA